MSAFFRAGGLMLSVAAAVLATCPLAAAEVSRVAAPDLIVVAEDAPWMAAVAAPVAGKLGRSSQTPLMVAVDFPPSARASWLIARAAPRSTVVLATAGAVRLGPVLPTLSPEILAVGIDPVYGSLAVARRFWRQSRTAVVAHSDDAEAIIAGALLADGLAAPLLIRDRAETREAMLAALRGLGVEQVFLAASDPRRAAAWAGEDPRVRVVPRRVIESSRVAQLGADKVRTVVLARVPDQGAGVGLTAWLGPYWCVARGAPLVLCDSASAVSAEAEVMQSIERHRLRPRTLTILADYGSIGSETVEIDAGPTEPLQGNGQPNAPVAPAATGNANGKYQVAREPQVPAASPEALALGVGRVPLAALGDASVWLARGLLRERLSADRMGRALLVANPSLDRRPLPLCEAISRVTAQELLNYRVPVDEFYGTFADSPQVLSAARNASLLIYEGHASYQDLIFVPYGRSRALDEYYAEALGALENTTPDAAPGPPTAEVPLPALPPLPPPPRKPSRLDEPLAGLPVAVLQSCDSLDGALLDRCDELGCTAVVGSVTAIHSGSGSMLVEAMVQSVLDRGGTLGEALRDAQNYLFCIEDLKTRRGLKEQAKTRRVAMSFRLWGDPELPVLGGPPREPQGEPVAARWTAPGEVTIQVPARRFPEVRSAGYIHREGAVCMASVGRYNGSSWISTLSAMPGPLIGTIPSGPTTTCAPSRPRVENASPRWSRNWPARSSLRR